MTVQIYTQRKLLQLYRLNGSNIQCGNNTFTSEMESSLPENRRIFVYKYNNRLRWKTPNHTFHITEEMIEKIIVE